MAETTFASLQDRLTPGIRARLDLTAVPFVPPVVFFGQLRAGRDSWVPAHNADSLLAAAGDPKELLDVPQAVHARCIAADPRAASDTWSASSIAIRARRRCQAGSRA